jgi:hypothetical protein
MGQEQVQKWRKRGEVQRDIAGLPSDQIDRVTSAADGGLRLFLDIYVPRTTSVSQTEG